MHLSELIDTLLQEQVFTTSLPGAIEIIKEINDATNAPSFVITTSSSSAVFKLGKHEALRLTVPKPDVGFDSEKTHPDVVDTEFNKEAKTVKYKFTLCINDEDKIVESEFPYVTISREQAFKLLADTDLIGRCIRSKTESRVRNYELEMEFQQLGWWNVFFEEPCPINGF